MLKIIIPAYGRKYANIEEARVDWLAGKDFKLLISGKYCSIRDFNPSDEVKYYMGDGLYVSI